MLCRRHQSALALVRRDVYLIRREDPMWSVAELGVVHRCRFNLHNWGSWKAVQQMMVEIQGVERNVLKKELRRFLEFADLADNAGKAKINLLQLQRRYGLLDM